MSPAIWICLGVAGIGAASVATTLVRSRSVPPDLQAFFESLDLAKPRRSTLDKPFGARLASGTVAWAGRRLDRLLPGTYLAKVERQLAQAGRSRGAGAHVAGQLGLALVGLALTPVLPAGPGALGALAPVLLPGAGFMLPSVGLARAVRKRSEAIFRDLPDIVDMLAIAVEAGSGFEAALAIVCDNFESPLTDELSIALREMELGLSRRQAFQQLRDRIDIDVVRALMLALLQADALGIPVGRVLKAQATEVRARRRAWAREKAAKLPVKIMFPLVMFIFPPIMALVLAPAALSFGSLGG